VEIFKHFVLGASARAGATVRSGRAPSA
jgi:hypothetical protein